MSTIAVLGWGSLLWRPETLAMASTWHTDGPLLPLEFARISGNKALTLVINLDSPPQQTYWVISGRKSTAEVRENLRERERCPTLTPIHALTRTGEVFGNVPASVVSVITAWLTARRDLDAVVWTGLGRKWERGPLTGPNVTAYLRSLDEPELSAAREYVIKAPPQIQTPMRAAIRMELEWEDVPLAIGTLID